MLKFSCFVILNCLVFSVNQILSQKVSSLNKRKGCTAGSSFRWITKVLEVNNGCNVTESELQAKTENFKKSSRSAIQALSSEILKANQRTERLQDEVKHSTESDKIKTTQLWNDFRSIQKNIATLKKLSEVNSEAISNIMRNISAGDDLNDDFLMMRMKLMTDLQGLVKMTDDLQTEVGTLSKSLVETGRKLSKVSTIRNLAQYGDIYIKDDVVYLVRKQYLRWNSAWSFCRRRGGVLLYIPNPQVNNFLKSWLYRYGRGEDFWIGAERRGGDIQWKTRYGWQAMEWENWAPGEPNSYSQRCIRLWGYRDWRWDDDYCNDDKYFICSIDI